MLVYNNQSLEMPLKMEGGTISQLIYLTPAHDSGAVNVDALCNDC